MADILAAPVWLLTNLLLVRAGWQSSRKLFPRDHCLQLIGHTTVIWWGFIVVLQFVLGILHLLNGSIILLAAFGLAIFCFWWCERTGNGNHSNELDERATTEAKLSTSITVSSPWQNEKLWMALWSAWFAYGFGRVVVGGLLQFPIEWDSLMYHIPLIDQWLQAHSLYAPDDAVWYNAANSELVGLWMVSPFSGDFLIALKNFPAVLLMVASGVEIGRQAGLTRWFRHLTTLAIVSNRVVTMQMLDAKNDLAVAALFLAFVAYGMRQLRGNLPALMLGAAAFGLLCGVKYYALGYAAVSWIVQFFAALTLRGRRVAGGVALAAFLGFAVFAGYWYVRNAYVTGTPIYPKGLTEDTDAISKIRPDLWRTTFLGSGRPEVLPLALQAAHNVAGPANLCALLLLPVVLAWQVASGMWQWLIAGNRMFAVHRLGLAALCLGTGLILGVTPFAVETTPGTMNMLRGEYLPVRFGLSFLSLTLVCFAVSVQDLSRGIIKILGCLRSKEQVENASPLTELAFSIMPMMPQTLFAAAAIYQLLRQLQVKSPGDKLESLVIGANVVILVLLGIHFLRGRQWSGRLALFVVLMLIGASYGVDRLASKWHIGFASFYDNRFGGELLQSLAKRHPNSTRICVLGYHYYPFFGSRRKIHASRPEYVPSYGKLLRYLNQRDANLIAVIQVDPNGIGRYFRRAEWLKQHPQVFKFIADTDRYTVWQIDQQALQEELRSVSPEADSDLVGDVRSPPPNP